jgi:2,4-dienoyl-CoA reductase-like NADH-dependent reductase (Old Yellow Enzyme family)
MTPHLFSPLSVGNLKLANRIVIAPMCQYSAIDGCMTDWHLIHLGHLALSGAALLTIEATAVLPEGRISYADVGLWDDATEASLGRIVESLRRWSEMPVAIQLAHAGRKASTDLPWKGGGQLPPGHPNGWQTVAPSALPFEAHENTPESLIETVSPGFEQRLRRRQRGQRGSGSMPSKSMPRMAISCTSFSRHFPIAVRTTMAAAWRTGCASRWRCSMR